MVNIAAGTVLCEKYEIIRQIGTGGSGSVYEARHRALNKRVAVKILFGAAAQVLARREALAGAIRSRNVVEINDVEVDGTLKVPLIVMEFLEGANLGSVVESRRRLEADETVTVLRGILSGVGRAHERGIVHGDLKPANVFCTETPNDERIVILDFGIASLWDSGTPSLTHTIGGTPLWMDPDALAGNVRTRSSDFWAIGLLAYYMLVGESYWASTSSSADLTSAILRGPRERPSVKALEGHHLSLPAWLDEFFLESVRQDGRSVGSAEELERLLPELPHRVPASAQRIQKEIEIKGVSGSVTPYVFQLAADRVQRLVAVDRDWLAALPSLTKTVLVAAGALPALLGLLAGFYQDVRKLLDRFAGKAAT